MKIHQPIRRLEKFQYVYERWNPHPPRQFMQWWPHFGAKSTEECTGRRWQGMDTVSAFNCEAVREVYRYAKEIGVLDQVIFALPDETVI